MTGLCWSIQTTFFISSKLGSLGTQSWKGTRYSSAIPKKNFKSVGYDIFFKLHQNKLTKIKIIKEQE